MNHKAKFVITIGLILASLLTACQPREVIKTVEVQVTKVVTQEVIKTVEVEVQVTPAVQVDVGDFVSLANLAEAIRAGQIDVGEEYGMAEGQRFHTIHATTVGMLCVQCHVQNAPEEVALAPENSPGQIDRRVCLGCHLNGPAQPLYDAKE